MYCKWLLRIISYNMVCVILLSNAFLFIDCYRIQEPAVHWTKMSLSKPIAGKINISYLMDL